MEEIIETEIQVKMFIRISRKDSEPRERAILFAKDEKGREFVFCYMDLDEDLQDLTVCDWKRT